MMIKFPSPRLLPVTITAMAVLLAIKCSVLVQAAATDARPSEESIMVASASAAGADKEHTQPSQGRSPPLSPPPADPPRSDPAHATSTAVPSTVGAPAQPAQPAASEAPPPVSDSERAILQRLRQRRNEIDARESSVVARESVLTAAEQKLTVRVAELQALQQKLGGQFAAQKQKQDAGWQAMVKMYEAMKPKEAAAIMNELPMPVLLPLMDRMKAAKAAAIMEVMTPEKARDVTSELAQMRTGQDASSSMPDPSQKPGPIGG
jgi:flagellar motility protein MotE (MotC chaperone)